MMFQEIDFANAFYGFFILGAKMSLFILLLRIFSRLTWLRNLVFFGIIFNFLYTVACFLTFAILCFPARGQSWTLNLQTPKCLRSVQLGFTQGAINIACDFYLLLIPLPAVLTLQIPTRKKLGIVSIFTTGLMYVASLFKTSTC